MNQYNQNHKSTQPNNAKTYPNPNVSQNNVKDLFTIDNQKIDQMINIKMKKIDIQKNQRIEKGIDYQRIGKRRKLGRRKKTRKG